MADEHPHGPDRAPVVALRALSSPLGVGCLVLLVLNDHVLKQAWPGTVTGKLSDLAGLVVAPLLLAVVLAPFVRRPERWAAAVVAGGFVAVKSSAAVAAQVSGWWSLSGFPTTIRADPTDLLAVPAVLVPVWLHRRADGRAATGGRRAARLALGVALVPVTVLATAATSCDPDEGVTRVELLRGDSSGPPDRTQDRLAALRGERHLLAVDGGDPVPMDPEDRDRVRDHAADTGEACAADGRCWRVVRDPLATVEVSQDGGRTWATDFAMSRVEAEAALDGLEGSCGHEPTTSARSLAVLDWPGGVEVAVAVSNAGVLVRDPDGRWSRIDLGALAAVPDGSSEGVPGDPPPGQIRTVPMVLPEPTATGAPEQPDPGAPPPPPCASPSFVTVTPHPSNGPPTAHASCP